MILVTGAAGKTGRAVVGQLVSRRLPVRALVYRAEHEALFRSADGVETNVGALEDAGVTERAMEGAQTVYFICPNVHEFEFVLAATAIELARRSGVERFVYHSVHLPAVEEMPHHWQKHLVEQALSTSGLDYTILQPCTYMQNILGQRTRIEQEREFEVPYSLDARMSLVDLEDVATPANLWPNGPSIEPSGSASAQWRKPPRPFSPRTAMQVLPMSYAAPRRCLTGMWPTC